MRERERCPNDSRVCGTMEKLPFEHPSNGQWWMVCVVYVNRRVATRCNSCSLKSVVDKIVRGWD